MEKDRHGAVSSLEDVDVAVVGLPFDTGATIKVGARFGPESVRSASHMLRHYNVELDVHEFETLSMWIMATRR